MQQDNTIQTSFISHEVQIAMQQTIDQLTRELAMSYGRNPMGGCPTLNDREIVGANVR